MPSERQGEEGATPVMTHDMVPRSIMIWETDLGDRPHAETQAGRNPTTTQDLGFDLDTQTFLGYPRVLLRTIMRRRQSRSLFLLQHILISVTYTMFCLLPLLPLLLLLLLFTNLVSAQFNFQGSSWFRFRGSAVLLEQRCCFVTSDAVAEFERESRLFTTTRFDTMS